MEASCMPNITLASLRLQCQRFGALFYEDKKKDLYEIIKSSKKVSKYMFPMITQVIKCGSRAEQLYLGLADTDYIYEVGPLLVGQKEEQLKQDSGFTPKNEILYFNVTKNPGFYTVCDQEGGYLHTLALQSRFAPVIHGVKQVASLEKTSVPLPCITLPPDALQPTLKEISALERQHKFIKGPPFPIQPQIPVKISNNEDSVIALKCQKWPKDVWSNFEKRKTGHLNLEQLKETPLYLVPKAHPNSENPTLEWRLSFSLVEKKIFESVPYIFRKVYLLCKHLFRKQIEQTREWRFKKFPSYLIKTVFLWTYADWQISEKKFTEDDILNMMLQLFSNLYKYYKEGVVPMYFIPELNLLDQYLETVTKVLFAELKTLADLQSLSFSICQHSSEPLSEFRDLFEDRGRSWIHFNDNLDFPLCLHPSNCNLWYLYKEKIEKHKGIRDDEEKLELLHELYVTFLYLLMEKALNLAWDDKLESLLYYLLVYGHNYIPGDHEPYNIIDFMTAYTASFETFFSVNFPRDTCSYEKLLLPNTCSSDEKIKSETQSILCKLYKKEELPAKWIDGDFDNIDISLLHEMYRFGNKEHSEILHKQIMEDSFSKFDLVFKSLVTHLNSYFSRRFKGRCLKEIDLNSRVTQEQYPHNCYQSYFLTHLVQDMFEMYSYGFTDGKFHLPTPAVYMSYLRQLLVNMTCKAQNEINNGHENVDPSFLIHGSMNDQWGFCVKEGNYVTYSQRKVTSLPFNWTLFFDK